MGHSILDEFQAARLRLSNAVAPSLGAPCPTHVDACVVGGGASGLVTANLLSEQVPDTLVLERSQLPGGVWTMHSNPHSRVNSSEPAYRLRPDLAMSNHSRSAEILNACAVAVEEAPWQLRLGKEVLHVKEDEDPDECDAASWVVHVKENDTLEWIRARLVVLCVNRRLGEVRNLTFAYEERFQGDVFRGLRGDAARYDFSGKRVLVVGMGAFAVENMRTALEGGAQSVCVLARRRGTSCPQVIDWVNFVRPFLHEEGGGGGMSKRSTPYSVSMFQLWEQAYQVSGATLPECWHETPRALKPDGHTVATSDIFFVAHWLGKVETHVGEVEECLAHGMRCTSGTLTTDTKVVDCDVLIKCVGFHVQPANERLLGRSTFHGMGLVDRNLWAVFEPHLDVTSFQQPFGSSILNGVECRAKLIRSVFRNPWMHERIVASSAQVGINSLTFEETTAGMTRALEAVPELTKVLQEHLEEVRTRCDGVFQIDEYVAANKIQWANLHSMLKTNAYVSSSMPYLFDDIPKLLREDEAHVAHKAFTLTFPGQTEAVTSCILKAFCNNYRCAKSVISSM